MKTTFLAILISAVAAMFGSAFTCSAQEPKLKLTIAADSRQYTFEDPIFVRATCSGAPETKMQFFRAEGFHVILRSKDGKRNFCLPASSLQLDDSFSNVGRPHLKPLRGRVHRQIIIVGDKLKSFRLEPGIYELRIGYALDAKKLENLLVKANIRVFVHPEKIGVLEGACADAVVSDPIVIELKK
jgi:hypothetical protein